MKKLYLSLSLALMCSVAFAVPAKRGLWKTVKLADGTEVKVELRGDEFCRYWQTEDGNVYVENTKKGIFEKAEKETLMKASAELRAEANEARAERARSVKAVSGQNKASYTGKKKGIIILVQFSDLSFKEEHTRELFDRIANEEGFNEMGFNGSVKDYFKAQSYGQFELDFDVAGPVTLPKSYTYYGENRSGTSQSGNEYGERLGEMVIDACKAVDDEFDYTQYDWDGDGVVDQVYILYAGRGEASGGGANTIWPHEWTLKSALGTYDYILKQPYVDGVSLNTYACGCELQSSTQIDGIGTLCHEFSHCLGLMDMYDTYGNSYGMDQWSLMAAGNYNGSSFTPAGFTSYERMQSGWLQPVELNENQTIENIKPLAEEPEAYIIYNDGNKNEYYLLENRQKVGYDAALPGAGLLITHVDYNATAWQYNVVNSPSGQRTYGVPSPHERCSIIQADYNSARNTTAGDVWPYMSRKDLTSTSTPAATVYNRNTDGTYNMNKSVKNITRNIDNTLSFDFSLDNDPSGISGITVDDQADGERGIYSIDGRYMGNDANALQKGIYIINGKKVVK